MEDIIVTYLPGLSADIIVLILCLCASAFFSASETAITSLGKLKTKQLFEESATHHYKRHLELWLKSPGRVITTILIFNTVVNSLATAVSTKIAITYSQDYGVGIATGAATGLLLIFGEVIPKSYGKTHSDTVGVPALRLIDFFYRMIMPLTIVLSSTAAYVIKAFGGKDTTLAPTITEDELEFLINESRSQGVIKDLRKDMISGVFDFDETKVREIMTPRIDIAAVEKNESLEELERLIIKTGHSRIPVYEDTIDNVVGMLFAKHLIQSRFNHSDAKITELMREPMFVPESKPIIEVFKDLKRHKVHMAIVIDEHGGTAGIITMEDILEEIVGEIQDEFDVEEAKVKKLEDNTFDVIGSMSVDEFAEYFDIDEDRLEKLEHDSDTVGGLVIHLFGEFPKIGRKIDCGPLELEVTELGRKRKRVERIRVRFRPDEVVHDEDG